MKRRSATCSRSAEASPRCREPQAAILSVRPDRTPLNRHAVGLLQRRIAACRLCPTLAPWRQFDRTAYGTLATRYVLVGEAPGYRSWRNRQRFTGPAGTLIRRALARVNDPRYPDLESLFYMTDAVKCHPAAHRGTANRSPRRSEAMACRGHLMAELSVLRPTMIVTFGKAAEAAVREALAQIPAAGAAARPALIAFPHPSPRNQTTIRRHYASFAAFERDIARTFRRLIAKLPPGTRHAGIA